MKIIVNNEREEKMIKAFAELIESDSFLELIQKEDKETAKLDGEEPMLSEYEYDFLCSAFVHVKTEVNCGVYPITIHNSYLTGHCSRCSTYTEGTIDGGDITLEEYENWINDRKNWKCESCMLECE